MSYTRAWSDATPAGTRAANQIDDAIREKCVDVHERMDTTFSVDWTTDPVVARPEILGNVTGKKILIPGYAFISADPAGTPATIYVGDGTFSGIQCNSGDPAIFAPLILPVGVAIKKVRWRATNGDTATLSMYLFSVAFTSGANRTQEILKTGVTAGDTIYDSGGVDIAADGTKMFYLAVDKSSGAAFKLWGAEVTYDTPDCRSTL